MSEREAYWGEMEQDVDPTLDKAFWIEVETLYMKATASEGPIELEAFDSALRRLVGIHSILRDATKLAIADAANGN